VRAKERGGKSMLATHKRGRERQGSKGPYLEQAIGRGRWAEEHLEEESEFKSVVNGGKNKSP